MIAGYFPSLTMGDYLADPAPEPSLNTSTVLALTQRTPLHAWSQHARLGGSVSDASSRADIGSAIHSAILGGAEAVYCDFADWRTKASQEMRDTARATGKLPLLERQRADVERASEHARAMLLDLGKGGSEISMLWQTEGAWCRGRADWLTDAYDVDVKTCDDADPAAWVRKCVQSNGYDVQAGLRSLGHKALGHERKMVWLLVELEAPYACSFVGVGPSMLDLAERKVIRAAKIWRKCLDANEWPGYSRDIAWAEAQTYALVDFEERAAR